MNLQNNEYKTDGGHRIIVVRENDSQVLLCRITPRTEATEQLLMDKDELNEEVNNGNLLDKGTLHAILAHCPQQ